MLRAPGTGAMRIMRGLMCAGMCLLLGCTAHAWNEGQLPGPGALVMAFGLLAVACVGLAGRQRDFVFIFAMLGGAQLFLHFGFAVMASWSAAASAAPHHHGVPGSMTESTHGVHDGILGWTAGMAVGHILATLISAACLAYGEHVVWWLARLVLPLLPALRPQPVPVPAAPLDPRADAFVLLPARHGVLLARGLVRRGPPQWSAA